MTVAELIERLQQLPGASDTRPVTLRVFASNYKPVRCGEAVTITSVQLERLAVVIEGIER